jgi:hypothetical protein
MVIQVCREYYEALTPEEMNVLRQEYIRDLRALEVPDGDRLLRVVSDEEVAKWREQQAQAANLLPKTSIATRYTELARPEQEQVLNREGIQPATPEELVRQAQDEAAKEGMKAQAKESAKPDQSAIAREKVVMAREQHDQTMQHKEEAHQQQMTHTVERAQTDAAAQRMRPKTPALAR